MDIQFQFKINKQGIFNAIQYNDLDQVRYIIEKGISVNTKDDTGWTPLMFAADRNNLKVVKLLVELGADLEQKNDDGETALMISAFSNSSYVSRYLISVGADPDTTDKNGRTAYEIAKELFPNEQFEYLLPNNKIIEKPKIKNRSEKKLDETNKKTDNKDPQKSDTFYVLKHTQYTILKEEEFFNKYFSPEKEVANIIKIEDLRNDFRNRFHAELVEDDIAFYFGYHKKLREKFKRLPNGDFQRIQKDYLSYITMAEKTDNCSLSNGSHSSSYANDELLRKMGASWFVSYAYFEKIDYHHENWNRISTVKSRISWYESSRAYHKSWLFQILSKDEGRLNTNLIGLSASQTKKMAEEIIIKCKYE